MRLLLISLIVLLTAEALQAQLTIITNKSVSEESLSKASLKKIFLGKKNQWKDNTKIHIVTLDNSEAHKVFLRKYLGRSVTQYKNWWKRMLFTGRGEPPKNFSSVEELVFFVSKTKGAIGYIDTTLPTDKVRQIIVD